jgi:hypothetical protein
MSTPPPRPIARALLHDEDELSDSDLDAVIGGLASHAADTSGNDQWSLARVDHWSWSITQPAVPSAAVGAPTGAAPGTGAASAQSRASPQLGTSGGLSLPGSNEAVPRGTVRALVGYDPDLPNEDDRDRN